MKIKKTITIIIITALLLSLVSCGANTDSPSIKNDVYSSSSPLPSAVFDIPSDVKDMAISEDGASLYLLYSDKITLFDLSDGTETEHCDAASADFIYADSGKIYTYSANEDMIYVYSNGALEKDIQCNFNTESIDRIFVYKNHFILVANDTGKSYPESNLYYANLENGSSKKLGRTYCGEDSFSHIVSADFKNENTIVILSYAKSNGEVCKLYEYNVVEDKQLSHELLPFALAHAEYSPSENSFIGMRTVEQIWEYDIETKETIELANRSDYEGYENKYGTEKFLLGAGCAVIWDNISNSVVITELKSDKDPLVIYTDNFSHLRLSSVKEKFESKYGIPVQIVQYGNVGQEYDTEIYENKIKTKLLAKDSDFDIYLLNTPHKDGFLDSALKKGVYVPLEEFEGVSDNFDNMYDGVREMMSYEGHIFGIPLSLYMPNLVKIDDKYSHVLGNIEDKLLSFDNIWKICDEISKSNAEENAMGRPQMILNFIEPFIQASLSSGKINSSELTEMLTEIKDYYDKGTLFFEYGLDADMGFKIPMVLNGAPNFFSYYITSEQKLVTEYPETGFALHYSYNDVMYQTIEEIMMANPYSDNKDAIGKFMELVTDEEVIYDLSIHRGVMLGKELSRYSRYDLWNEAEIYCLERLPAIYKHSKVYTVSMDDIEKYIEKEILEDFYTGKISPEKAAKKICDYVEYTYLG